MYNSRDFKFTIGQKTQQNKQTTTKKTQTNKTLKPLGLILVDVTRSAITDA